MALCELIILFDKEDRRYYTDEPISGKVMVKANKDFSFNDIQLDYGWRTHGWGNKDEGDKGSISLVKRDLLAFRDREVREFPFRIPAQCGPLTYHGHYVNVDWYLKASLTPPGFLMLATHAEEDFLLLDRNMSIDPLPASPPEQLQNKSEIDYQSPLAISFALLLVILMLLGFMSTTLKAFLTLGTLFALIIAWSVRRKIINFVLQRIIGIEEAQVSPLTIQPGCQARCCIEFQAKFPIYLEHITVVVRALENSISGSGTQVFKKEYTQYYKQTVKSYYKELEAGQWITFDCSVPIPANAPPTFNASNNSINWFFDLQIACRHLPSWEKTIPIVVVSRSA